MKKREREGNGDRAGGVRIKSDGNDHLKTLNKRLKPYKLKKKKRTLIKLI